MRIVKCMSIDPETLKAIEEAYGDLDKVNFSEIADTALAEHAKKIKDDQIVVLRG